MSRRKIVLVIVSFILLLTGLRLTWYGWQAPPEHPQPRQGEVDLSHWDFEGQRPITLNGEWEFYPQVFLSPGEPGPTPVYVKVPGNWTKDTDGQKVSPHHGYGTYRLRLLVKADDQLHLGLRFQHVMAASAVYINGELKEQMGGPAATDTQFEAKTLPYTVFFTSHEDEVELLIHTSNLVDPRGGGVLEPVLLGSSQAINKAVNFSSTLQLIVALSLVLHALYTLILYFMSNRQKEFLCFALLALAGTLQAVVVDDKLLLVYLNASHEWSIKLLFLALSASALFIMQLAAAVEPSNKWRWISRWSPPVVGLLTAVSMLLPTSWLFIVFPITALYYLSAFFIALWPFWRLVQSRGQDAIYLLLTAVAITVNVLWGIVKNTGQFNIGFYPFDFLFAFIGVAVFWFKGYIKSASAAMELSQQLQAADEAKDHFLASTAHELRNPLHGMLSIAQTMLQPRAGRETDGQNSPREIKPPAALSAEQRASLALLIDIGQRMSLLLDDLLDLSRLQEKGLKLELGAVRVQGLVEGVVDILRYELHDRPVSIITELPAELPPVLADENRLIQILFNLMHNAISFTERGSVTIGAREVEGGLQLSVADTGVGMSAETLQSIFEPYVQAGHNASSSGIGLGLSISKELVRLHGGTLTAQSTLGEGSTFTFTLPLADRDLPPGQVGLTPQKYVADVATEKVGGSQLLTGNDDFAHSKPLAADTASILIVDDDALNLRVLSDILGADNHLVIPAGDAGVALSLLDSREWDLVIADVMMPNISGFELTRIIRHRFTLAELPVLLLTARAQVQDIEAGFLAGANDYVTKPVEAMELRARVAALTALKKSARQQRRLEAATLQAQIEPHFLLNTLNAISSLSASDHQRMRKLLGVFGDYLRASFDPQNLDRLVPLSRELHLVRSYLYILQERFGKRLEVVWLIDEAVKPEKVLVPPLSIQPLVENACSHGLLVRVEGGVVKIKINISNSLAEIVVQDDGVGMTGQQVEELLMIAPQPQPDQGIGLWNTNRRLHQLFGHGLKIESHPGLGTTVSFQVPLS